MSQTVRQEITRALRWINQTGTGRRAPNDTEAADGLADFQALYLDIIDRAADFTDVIITAAHTAAENERISGGFTVTYPTSITDQDTQEVRPPHDFAVIREAKATPVTKTYDANLAAWVAIESLTLDSVAPWSTALGQGLSAMLAVAIADGYGHEVPPVCAGFAAEARLRVEARMQMSGQDRGSVFFQPDRMRV